MLITEALAELKTLVKRIEKKREYVRAYLYRPDGLKDPLEKDGGSQEVLKKELQAIMDLNKRVIDLRTSIQKTNLSTPLTVEGATMSIAEWLTWRKEVSDGDVRFISQARQTLLQARTQAQQRGASVLAPGATAQNPSDVIVNVDEGDLAKQAEKLETILGTLDGQLSLKNATIQVEGIS